MGEALSTGLKGPSGPVRFMVLIKFILSIGRVLGLLGLGFWLPLLKGLQSKPVPNALKVSWILF